jgi:hypothetical protein
MAALGAMWIPSILGLLHILELPWIPSILGLLSD